MHRLDWMVLAVPMLIVTWIAIKTQRYMKSVADFMAGGRAAGRYLLTTAGFVTGLALIGAVATFESQYKCGLVYGGPWSVLLTPLNLIILLTGYVIWRYRETRVMTMAQFFEVRYSKRFRIFSGILCSASGILNYGIFPAVGGRFFVYFCGLPEKTPIFGYGFPTFAIVMIFFLGAALALVLLGGQFTALVTDGVQAIIAYGMLAVVSIYLIWTFSKGQMMTVLESQPPGKSFINPWDIDKLQDFNIWYWLIGAFGGYYGFMSWQGGHAFNASASTPQEAKMGRILGTFRGGFSGIMYTFVVVAALTFMNHPDFASQIPAVKQAIAHIGNPAIQTQMTVPLIMSHLLPVGIKGCFCAILLFGMITTDVSYLHSWGSIIIQDVVLPLRKKPFEPETQIRLIRLAILGVAIFAFFFSLLFYQTTYILMFFALTGTLYTGGAGACIVGGMYWRRGSTAGAWGAMISGTLIAILGFLGEQYWASIHPILVSRFGANAWLAAHPDKFPINGQWVWGIAMLTAVCLYIALSLLAGRRPFNLDRMLHRGQYAVDAEGKPLPSPHPPKLTWRSFIGIDPDMSKGDRRLTYLVFGWTYFWWLVGMVILVWNLVPVWRWPTRWWSEWFFINTYTVGIGMAVISTIWFTWGGIRDLRRMFKTLATRHRNFLDDGRVIDHHNVGESLPEDM